MLSTASIAITVTTIVAVLAFRQYAHNTQHGHGLSGLANPQTARDSQVLLAITVALVTLGLWEQPDWSAVTPVGWLCCCYIMVLPMTAHADAGLTALVAAPASMRAYVLSGPVPGPHPAVADADKVVPGWVA